MRGDCMQVTVHSIHVLVPQGLTLLNLRSKELMIRCLATTRTKQKKDVSRQQDFQIVVSARGFASNPIP